jgi:hypothetical protein
LPSTVFVRNDRSYYDGSSFVVVGEAVNGGPASVFNVKIIAAFYDAGNHLVGAQEVLAFLPQTQVTQANPFKLQLANAPGNITRYELALTWDDFSVVQFDRPTITREEVKQEDGLEITGDLRNDHRSTLRNLVMVATFYDAAGAVLDIVPGTTAAPSLAPGESTTFSIAPGHALSYSSYLIQGQGVLLP